MRIYSKPYRPLRGGEEHAELYLDRNGAFTYYHFLVSGKYGTGTGVLPIDTPKELAEEFSLGALRKLLAYISTGLVYEKIREDLEDIKAGE